VLAISAVRVGTTPVTATPPTMQVFPRARFQELSEDERLTQKTFESFPAGVAIVPDGDAAPTGTVTTFDFERVNLAPDGVTTPPTSPDFPGQIDWHLNTGRAARSELLHAARLVRGAPARDVEVGPPPIVVVDGRDLADAAQLTDVEAHSPTLARQRAKAGQLVVEAHEIGV
jgi:hypothetical protein